jgi:hypothetical protein
MVKSFRFAYSSMPLIVLVLSIILLMFSLPLLQDAYAAESFKGLPFSVEIPDTWAYTETPEPPIEHMLGVTSYTSVVLVPVKFAESLIQEKGDIAIGNESAAIVFAKASDYSVKNAPLDLYVKYRMSEDDSLNVMSRQDTIVGKEKAVRIDGSKNDTSGNTRLLEYLLMHKNEPYVLRFIAGGSEFERYLPEFELMIKGFTFRENNTEIKL